ncbi:hypothetical protein DFJ74DRAFT_457116 [Hyaloraphidium curvatum]|nr:hypothetical protein DFJ74DRAFT_457116 [Hyaloraphidium curvatum]
MSSPPVPGTLPETAFHLAVIAVVAWLPVYVLPLSGQGKRGASQCSRPLGAGTNARGSRVLAPLAFGDHGDGLGRQCARRCGDPVRSGVGGHIRLSGRRRAGEVGPLQLPSSATMRSTDPSYAKLHLLFVRSLSRGLVIMVVVLLVFRVRDGLFGGEP